MSGDPVSWLLIQPGWRVLDAEGEPVGKVHQVLGDTRIDIFDGLAVAVTLNERRYVPAELVAEIVDDGCVHLAVPREGLDGAVSAYGPPPRSMLDG
jgi:hypothetical protein